jgi:hypothetical protein
MKPLNTAARLAVLAAACLGPAAWAADNVLTASSHVYAYVPGDLAGGGTSYADAPPALDGATAGSTATSSLNRGRTGDNGYGRVGTSSGADTTTASYGWLTAVSTATVTTHGDPFLDGDTQTDSSARFDDLVTFYNPNFAPGVSFSVRFTMTVAFAGVVDANNFARSYAVAQGGLGGGIGSVVTYESSTGNASGDLNWHDPLVQTMTFSVVNGEAHGFFGSLVTKTEGSLYNGYCDNCTGTVTASIPAATVSYTLIGVDPGLELSTASGYLYDASAVPEPAAAAMWSLGLAALVAALTRRRPRQATCP